LTSKSPVITTSDPGPCGRPYLQQIASGAAAATVASLEYLKQEPLYEHLERITADLTRGLHEVAEDNSIPLRIQGVPGAFHASVATPTSRCVNSAT
jgi:glutamate-1-semialdehyde aminotransferase